MVLGKQSLLWIKPHLEKFDLRTTHQYLVTNLPTLTRMMFLRIPQHSISTEKAKMDQKLLSLKNLGRGTTFFQIYHMRGSKHFHLFYLGGLNNFVSLSEWGSKVLLHHFKIDHNPTTGLPMTTPLITEILYLPLRNFYLLLNTPPP